MDKEKKYNEWQNLMVQAQAGNKTAYNRLLTEIYPALLGFIAGKSNPDDAEDIVQDILVSLHRAMATYDPGKPFSSWMYAIARYKLIDFYRKSGRSDRLEEKLKEEFGQETAEGADQLELLHDLLGRLPEKQQKVIRFLKFENLSVRETARLTGMSESAVKVNAHRGYNNLKKYRREMDENR